MSSKPKGGRGHNAPYETTHLRVPVPIKEQLQLVIDDYKELVVTGQIEPSEYVVQNFDKEADIRLNKQEAIEIAKAILNQKKSARQSLNKLLTALYKEEIVL